MSFSFPRQISYVINAGTVVIQNYAYKGKGIQCTHLIIPEGVIAIGAHAFYGFHGLRTVNLPDSLIYIGNAAFGRCTNLKLLNLPKNLKYIGSSAFFSCNSLTKVCLPENLKYIGSFAFFSCNSLMKVCLPENSHLISIGADAFKRCATSLSYIVPTRTVLSLQLSIWLSVVSVCNKYPYIYECVFAVFVAELRLYRQNKETALLPFLSNELWCLILEFVPQFGTGK
jgi:hypothetical protein